MDFVLLPNKEALAKPGKLFIEGRIRGDVRDILDSDEIAELKELLKTQFASGDLTFELFEDILADNRSADLRLGVHLSRVKGTLQSLKVVEYLGPDTERARFSNKDVRIEVEVYGLHESPRLLDGDSIPQAEITPMPHARFDGIWDEYGTWPLAQRFKQSS